MITRLNEQTMRHCTPNHATRHSTRTHHVCCGSRLANARYPAKLISRAQEVKPRASQVNRRTHHLPQLFFIHLTRLLHHSFGRSCTAVAGPGGCPSCSCFFGGGRGSGGRRVSGFRRGRNRRRIWYERSRVTIAHDAAHAMASIRNAGGVTYPQLRAAIWRRRLCVRLQKRELSDSTPYAAWQRRRSASLSAARASAAARLAYRAG